MKAIIVAFVIAVLVSAHGAEGNMASDLITQYGGRFVEVVAKCTGENNVNFENIIALFTAKFSPTEVTEPDASIQCAMTCVLQTFGLADENGKLQFETYIDMIPNEAIKNKINEEVGDCLKEAESKTDEEHKCSGLHYFGKCMFMKTINTIREKLCGPMGAPPNGAPPSGAPPAAPGPAV
ncbi:hypothetical protein L9F63_000612 [Diploptera punctata]|uniref:Uncharacterized protein n=1 Tax=Diploptera punctata TaxID=6984 RepID=A0AAD8AN09_DIPPU|nr:hypothetical protein L9F63_000612 [Diploptera punctata]